MARHPVPDLQDRVEYALFSGLLAVLASSSLATSRAHGRRLGTFVSRFLPIRKEVALDNIGRAFPRMTEKERLEVYRGMCRNFGITLADFARFRRKDPDPMDRVIHSRNLEAIGEAQEQGRGTLLVSAHYGNWELMVADASSRGYRVTALGARQRNPLVESLINRLRINRGTSSISVDRSLKPVLRALSEGECVATLADQDGGREGFFMPFLGRTASVQSGIFRLAARKRIPVVTGRSVWSGTRWEAVLDPPEWPREGSSPDAVETEARRLAALYTRRVEEWVREYPDHWFWVHRRWKTRPPARGTSPSRQIT